MNISVTSRTAVICLTLVAVLLSPVPGSSTMAAGQQSDPWYQDLAGHWARNYIRVLWEETVTDGFVHEFIFPWLTTASFYPGRDIPRGQWAMFLVKAFGYPPDPAASVPLLDVPSDHTEYRDKPAAGYIYATVNRGLLEASNRRFQPDAELSREVAVSGLIAALELIDAANFLSDAEVAIALSRFTDSRRVSRDYRRAVALAVRLGIIQGYPDSTLRPRAVLSRAEAATILYRSCVIRIDAAPNPFSPDGDGYEDTTTFTTYSMKNRNLQLWYLEITPADSRLVVFRRHQLASGPAGGPYVMLWDGRDNQGDPVPDGLYFYRATARDRSGNSYDSVARPLWVQTRSLQATVRPPVVLPGSAVTIIATTTAAANTVSARDTNSGVLQQLASQQQGPVQTWIGTLPVHQHTLTGQYEVEVKADWGPVQRETVVSYEVVASYRVVASVHPSVCPPDTTAVIVAWTNGSADSVFATTPWHHPIPLTLDGGIWTGEVHVPADTCSGTYDILVTAEFPGHNASAQVPLTVSIPGSVPPGFTFVLTD